MALPPGSNPDQSIVSLLISFDAGLIRSSKKRVEQVYFSADKADIAKQPLLAQRNYEKLSNVIQTQQYAAEENKNDELISSLTDLQTNCFQPKLSALFEFNYKNIYQQLPQDVLQAVAKRLTEPKYMAPINADLLFKNFPLPKVVAAPPKKPSFKHFKPIAVPSPVTNTTPQNNGHNTNNNHHVNATRSNGTYVSPFNNHHHDSMDIDSDNNSHVTSNQSHVSAVNNNSHVARPQQSNTTNNSKDQLLPSRANNTSNNAVNKTSPPLPQKQPPTAANNTSAANKSNGTSANKTTPNMNSVTNSLLNKRPRNTFYGKASGENDDEEEEQSPPQQQDKPRDFKTGFERLQEENAKNGQSTSTTSSANSRTQLLGKRKRNFQTPFKKSPEEEEEEARAAKKAKETTEQPLYKNVDPEMIERIENEILEAGVQVKFDDIAGLENVKKTLDEMIIQPAKRPDLFQGLRAPPRGLLLFGPPGNGKTMIAKAIATEAGLTFFSISASSLTSKWIGEGEKMVRALFAVAKVHQPSFIFIDEIDALLAMRSNEEHESSRRLKNEFLTQFDGATTSAKERVTVMGATNRPQDLDEAARRRLVRRIYVPLPGKEARMHLMQYLLSNESHTLTRGDLEMLGDMTEGYSGHDITNLCKDAAMGPLREHQSYIATVDEAAIRPVNIDDFRASLSRIKPSVAPEETQQFEDWNTKFGVSAF